MRRRLLLIALPLALIIALIGCSPKWNAKWHLKPVVKEIESFKRKQGRVPDSLEELQAKSGKTVKLVESSGVGLVWSIQYEKKSAESYQVSFHHVHYDLYYADGKQTRRKYNPFR